MWQYDIFVQKGKKRGVIVQRLWWLNLIRGIVALIVGMLILGWPTIGSPLFVNFLAIFWLAHTELPSEAPGSHVLVPFPRPGDQYRCFRAYVGRSRSHWY
jgi:hypothetical protein